MRGTIFILGTLYLVAVVLGGCASGGTAPTILPATPSTVSSVAASTPSAEATASARQTIDPSFCELAIDAGAAFETALYTFGAALLDADTEAMDKVVDDSVNVPRSLIERIPEGSNFALINLREKLTALSDSRLKYLTGDSEPFIDAVGDAAVAGKVFRTACGSG